LIQFLVDRGFEDAAVVGSVQEIGSGEPGFAIETQAKG